MIERTNKSGAYLKHYKEHYQKFGWKQTGSTSRTTSWEKDGYTAETENGKVVLRDHYDYVSSGYDSISYERDTDMENYEEIKLLDDRFCDNVEKAGKAASSSFRWTVGTVIFCIISLLVCACGAGAVSVMLLGVDVVLIVITCKKRKKEKQLLAESVSIANEAEKLLR